MKRVNPVLFVIVLFVAGFAAAYFMRLAPEGTRSEGKALIGGPFSLVDTDGKRVTDRDFRGKLMLVFFGYTHCPDVCPTEMQNMADAMDKLGADAKEVAPIFISVDPARDTPQTLSVYVKNFGPSIIGLTGSVDEVASAAKAYRVYFRKGEGGSNDYTVDHSVFVYLMDRQGEYITHFMFNTPADAIASEIKKHISDDKST
ncbi:MAG: SCO family protein [Rhodomicrobium sp.]